VVITGASGGIGAGIARRFAQAGARITVHYRGGKAEANALIAELGSNAIALHADVTDENAVGAMMDEVVDRFGGIDVLINNAALQTKGDFLTLDPSHFDRVVRANVGGIFRCSQAAARRMGDRGGVIVNVASISGLEPAFSHSHYCASKAAVIMLTKAAALELGPKGIRVNAVAPGLIWTEGLKENWPEGVVRWLAHAPLGRVGTSDDVADACLFLSSPASRWITGTTITVDGGVTTHPSY
jgi:NAD(P)-dependent dehydrogenase (short-subunit alcohol dehydrogenase family)